MQWENVPVFISSTFNDMHAERDYLVKKVFPQLSAWCEERKLRLIDIDLRWGVSEADATQNKRVVQVCLDRIDECRPFFLCFLGQRRGWVPCADDISDETNQRFPLLTEKGYTGGCSVTEMEILHALIDPLHNGAFFDRDNVPHDGKSVEHAFFFLRDPDYLDALPNEALRGIYTNEAEPDPAAADKELADWREQKVPQAGRPVHAYSAQWQMDESTPEIAWPLVVPTTAAKDSDSWANAFSSWESRWASCGVAVDKSGEIAGPELKKAKNHNAGLTHGRLGGFRCADRELADVVIAHLKSAIEMRFPDHMAAQAMTPLQKELDQQAQFLRLAGEGFIERKGDLAALNDYLGSDEVRPFAVTAFAGMGKTSLLAHWIDARRLSGETLHYRLIGGSDDSVNIERLWRSLLDELKDVDKISSDIPANPTDMMNKLPDLLAEAGCSGKTVIVIDALNQLESGISDWYWIPSTLPQNVKLIVSFKRGGAEAEEYYRQQSESGGMILHSVKPFESNDDRKALVAAYLSQYFKELDEPRIAALTSSDGAENPLFLKATLSELRVFGVHNDLSEVIRSRFGNTPKAAFDAILARMESDPAYTELMPAVALPHVFGWIAHSRYGLSVDEISALMTREGLTAKTEDAQDAVYLILRQLRPFLAKRDGRVDFFYESFKIAAAERYTSGLAYARPAKEWHKSLAEYLETLPLENRHRLMEQAWQYYKAVLPEKLSDLLNDAMYISAKQKGMLIDLLNDYDRFAEIHLPGQSDMSDTKERLRSLAPILWEYPQISDQTLLGGLHPLSRPLSQLRRIELLKEQVCAEGGVELLGLGGDVYSSTGTLYLDKGRFLAISPNGKFMLAIDSAHLAVYDTSTFRQVHSYPAAINEQQTFMGAISNGGKIALMDTNGVIYSENAAVSAVSAAGAAGAAGTISADKRFLLYSDGGGLLFVKDGNICSTSGAVVQVIAKGIPSVVCIKESRIAFVLDGEIHIYQYSDCQSDCQWACIASFPTLEPNIKAIAISNDLNSIIILSLSRRMIRYDVTGHGASEHGATGHGATGQILNDIMYVTDAKLPLVRLPYGCGEDISGRWYFADSESNAACYDFALEQVVPYRAGLEANHPKATPVDFAVADNYAIILLNTCAITIGHQKKACAQGHVGGVSSLGFLENGRVFTQMRNDSSVLTFSEDGELLYADKVMFPLCAASGGNQIVLSFANHNLVMHSPGINDTDEMQNMPMTEACDFLDCFEDMTFMGTRHEVKAARMADCSSGTGAPAPWASWAKPKTVDGQTIAYVDERTLYKTQEMEQIVAMAAFDRNRAALALTTADLKTAVGLAENGCFSKIFNTENARHYYGICVSPDKRYLCTYGKTVDIIDIAKGSVTTIARECRSACFLSENILVCAFLDTALLSFLDVSTGNPVTFVYIPDRVQSLSAKDSKVLCGLISGRAAILNCHFKEEA